MKTCLRILIVLLAYSGSAHALEGITGRVTRVEATGMPTWIKFTLDTGNATCPAGGWVQWVNSSTDNNKAVYAMLTAALVSGKQIAFFFNDGDTTCNGAFIHIVDM